MLCLDLKTAFDTVNHNILIKKLEHYGIRYNVLMWFRSYLTDRKQYVSLNGSDSETRSITCGVPEKLKIVKVIPVHKNGSTQDMNNLHPIPLLSIFDKIMEKLMHTRLDGFLEE